MSLTVLVEKCAIDCVGKIVKRKICNLSFRSERPPVLPWPLCKIHNGNIMISVHEWIQTTQEGTKKSFSEWVITSSMELGGDQDSKPARKVQKSTDLPWSLRKDPQWQQPVFSVCVDPMNPTEDQKFIFIVGHHLCHGTGG